MSTSGSDAGNTCRLSSHPCRTISYALSVAQSGDTISVAAGTYDEQLDITKDITIKGAAATGSNATIIAPTSLTTTNSDTDSTTPLAVIVMVEPGVTAANLKNLQVNGGGSSGAAAASISGYACGVGYDGVYYRDAAGSMTTVNVTAVQEQLGLFGCQGGDTAVYAATDSGSTTPSNVSMTHVTVNQYDKNGITCDDPGTSCTITSSTVSGLGPIPSDSSDQRNTAQNGIQVYGADASITSTVVSGNSYTAPGYSPTTANSYYTASGILVINAGTLTINKSTVKQNDANIYALWYPADGLVPPAGQGAWSITGNTATAATNATGRSGAPRVPSGNGFGDGIDLDGAGTGGTGSTTVTGNTASSGAEYGIGLLDTVAATVSGNHTNSNTLDGVYVGDNPYTGTSGIAANQGASTGNTVSMNTANSNKVDGILADTTAQDTGNTFTSNGLASNIHYDAEDLSLGNATGGTANSWSANTCKPAGDGNPEPICTS